MEKKTEKTILQQIIFWRISMLQGGSSPVGDYYWTDESLDIWDDENLEHWEIG